MKNAPLLRPLSVAAGSLIWREASADGGLKEYSLARKVGAGGGMQIKANRSSPS